MNRGKPKKGNDNSSRRSPDQTYPKKKHKVSATSSEGHEIEIRNKPREAQSGLPAKLKAGTLGRRIKLITNCYPLNIPDGVIYHYDVTVKKNRVSKSCESESSSENSDSEENTTDRDERNPETEIADNEDLTGAANQRKTKKKKYNCLNTKLNRQVIKTMIEAYDVFKDSHPVFDGKSNLYTRHPLDIGEKFKCEVVLGQEAPFHSRNPNKNRMTHFRVVLKPIKTKDSAHGCEISLEPLHAFFEGRTTSAPEEAMMALETVLRNTPCLRLVPVGRSFFYLPHPDYIHPLGGGKEIWYGYRQSIRLGQWKPMVNLDTTATAFYKRRPLLQYIAETLETSVEGLNHMGAVDARSLNRMSRELKNLKIEVTHLRGYRRPYRIQEDLTVEGANRTTFEKEDENGRRIRMTVAEYFARTYQRLRFPHLPCIQIKCKVTSAEGETSRMIFLPVEVCEIVEQHCNKELTPKEVTEMIKFTAKPPSRRFEEIEGVFRNADFKNDEYLKEFEMEVLPQPMRVEARVLDPPSLRYDQENKVKPNNGVWNMIGQKYFGKACVKSWVLLSFADSKIIKLGVLEKFAECLKDMANTQGIQMGKHKYLHQVKTSSCSKQDAQNILVEMKNKYGTDLIVIVLQSNKAKNKTIYNAIKRVAETTGVGIITQCMKADNVIKCMTPKNPKYKFDASFISNLCLKINTKMGGVNHLLTPGETPVILRDEPVIVIGADVNHPGPTDARNPKPSLAAVVATLNSNASRYAVTLSSQINAKENKQVEEIIRGLKDMVVSLLKEFYIHTRQKPQKIIFYRDGVSDGQFKEVQKEEIKSIREACESLPGDYRPGITYIIVQKRHHFKSKPVDERDGAGPMKNVPPGSVIDTTVTHPLNADFFLYGHLGIKGTSRPGYYTVAADDNEFTADQLEKLTYFLCYAYARCTRSISLPAPVQYAHLAAYRARLHLMSREEEGHNQGLPRALEIDPSLKDSMYFI
ncbi:hypothetical protein JTE90_023898 [Oedothorax gibbosus]|uniref:Uncharacterized protein n=1 Tax=Oedothorax gibbosus TaxID=931172 RepID=A0AAV6UNH9_9ARAC|nr:hypothetical protein JTE90_023898 [Oedothorax gibbosus]